MTFAELLSLTKFILNFNDGQADQDFSDLRLKELLNLVYTDEVNKAKQEGVRRYFRKTIDLTWGSGDVTFSLPSTVSGAELIRIRDVTDDAIGHPVSFSEEGETSTVFFKDHNTLQWGTQGPNEDKTLRFVYYAQPEKLVDDDDIPALLPSQFHSLLAWSAAVYAREIADEAAPTAWTNKLYELRLDLWKMLSKGRPTSGQGGGGSDGGVWDLGEFATDGSSINQDNST